MNPKAWTSMDNAIDDVLKETRASPPNAPAITPSLVKSYLEVKARRLL